MSYLLPTVHGQVSKSVEDFTSLGSGETDLDRGARRRNSSHLQMIRAYDHASYDYHIKRGEREPSDGLHPSSDGNLQPNAERERDNYIKEYA